MSFFVGFSIGEIFDVIWRVNVGFSFKGSFWLYLDVFFYFYMILDNFEAFYVGCEMNRD